MGKYKELKKRVEELERKFNLLHPENINVQFEQVNELPEKWCLKHSEEALGWIRKNAEANGECICTNVYYMYPANIAGNNSSYMKPEGYTEITFDTFKRLVLKEEPKEEQPIDWSVPGQLVISTDEDKVLILTLPHKRGTLGTFTGIVLSSNGAEDKGEVSDDWASEDFTLCTEPITLENIKP